MRFPLVIVIVALACGCSERSLSPTAPSTPLPPAAFALQGDPESGQGATWTYKGSLQGTTFDLQGVLLKPAGPGPFPAVVISHGAGGNATGYSRAIALTMRGWGLVGIATNYTHAAGVPIGSPGTINDPGASQANALRAYAMVEILRTLGYVGVEVVHQHSERGLLLPTLTVQVRAARRAYNPRLRHINFEGAARTKRDVASRMGLPISSRL